MSNRALYAALLSHAQDGEMRGPFPSLFEATKYALNATQRQPGIEYLTMRSDDNGATWRPVFPNGAARAWWYSDRTDRKVTPA